MAKRVFISKHASESQVLNDHLIARGDLLVSHSFLLFEEIEAEIEEVYDVVFFGSPRGVIFFKSQCSIPNNVSIACVGAKTAELLQQMGHSVNFQGASSGRISEVAQDFRQWCGARKVLFPSSDISLKSISSLFPENQKIEVAVYSTKVQSKKIEACDLYVFTSPSNVKGFLELNTLSEKAIVLAWGESTAKFLLEEGVKVNHQLEESSIEAVIEYLNSTSF